MWIAKLWLHSGISRHAACKTYMQTLVSLTHLCDIWPFCFLAEHSLYIMSMCYWSCNKFYQISILINGKNSNSTNSMNYINDMSARWLTLIVCYFRLDVILVEINVVEILI